MLHERGTTAIVWGEGDDPHLPTDKEFLEVEIPLLEELSSETEVAIC